MRWFLLFFLVFLVGCSGNDDDDSANAVDSAGSPEVTAQSDDAATEPADTGSNGESATNPDVHLPLVPGSSGEVASDDPDPFSETTDLGMVKVTIVRIIDPATTENEFIQPEAGWRYWAVEVTMEATSDTVVNTGVWTASTSDGNTYETVYLTGVGEDIFYGPLEPGQSLQGVVVFEIPEDVAVESLKMNPSIFVGGNLIFDA